MMGIMPKNPVNARAAAKDASHERIVAAASRAIRRSGYAGTGVADIMKEAGLTHGAFYAHFMSRDAMLAEAADHAGSETIAKVRKLADATPPEHALDTLIRSYLSPQHLKNIDSGCPMAALGSEMPRQSPEVRRAATARIREMVDLVARAVPDAKPAQAREQSLFTVAAMVGALMLARAVDDPALSKALCKATLKHLSNATD
jgi:AcrR family transcriptional regulator